MKTLLYGGTFDPPHNGHMNNLRAALALVQPDRALVMPAGTPPHKHASATPAELRLQMCACFTALSPAVQVSDWEIRRGGRSYTVHTLEWLRGRVQGGLIARVGSREEALTHFLNGETAIFMDWQSAYSGLYAREMEKNGVEIVEMPYPSSTGFVIRSFELTGACVAAGTDNTKRELAMRAIAFWHEDAQTQMALGDRGIWQDDAVWLPEIDATQKGMTQADVRSS